MPRLIDLGQARVASSDDLSGLHAYLVPLIGELFRFVRMSYGDELTLHFGNLRPARSPKLKLLYGDYLLGVRASTWLLKAGGVPLIVFDGIDRGSLQDGIGQTISNKDLEARTLVEPGSCVLSATPFVIKPANQFGLRLCMADGSTVQIVPAATEIEEPEDHDLAEITDWELIMPNGVLTAGPGLCWSWEPHSAVAIKGQNNEG